uniref:PD-(D/E)XK nuclease superfamily protein n=1 Tax=viral metagenome TaxID=1070528 RepID=A0A6M3JD72_9ZZZZ
MMEILDYPELAEEMYGLLIKKVSELTVLPRTAGIHMTELIYCLTSAYWDKIMPLPFTKQQAITMALGIGFERVLIPEEMRAKPGTCEGIEYSPDFWFRGNLPSELKTTRMSTIKTHKRDFPESWVQQIMGYCYAEKKLGYGLGIVHLMGGYKPPFPEILAVKFKFDQQELQANWDFLKWRMQVYINALAEQRPPTPTKWCKDWECGFCRYAVSPIHCNIAKG